MMKGYIMCMFKIFGMCILATQLHGGTGSKNPILNDSYTYVDEKTFEEKVGTTGNLYTPESRPGTIGANFYTKDTRYGITFNSGIDTEKFDKNQSLKISANKHIPITDNLSINIGGGYTFGGDERHTSCTDATGLAEFNCTDGTPWVDFDQPENKPQYNAGFTIRYTF